MKICNKCKEAKEDTEFGKNKDRASGLCSQCKTCSNEPRNTKEKRAVSALNSAITKVGQIEFQQIHGYGMILCKDCGKIAPRGKKDERICKPCLSKRNSKYVKNSPIRLPKSKHKGVYTKRGFSKYTAQIMHQYKQISLGCFDTEIEAAQAYNNYVIEHNLNRPLNIIYPI